MSWTKHVRAERPVWKDGVDLYLYDKTDEKLYVYALTAETKEYSRHDLIPAEASLGLTDEQAQQLMDELWRVGLRPRNGESSMAHVDAMKAHLSDLRHLVFKQSPFAAIQPEGKP